MIRKPIIVADAIARVGLSCLVHFFTRCVESARVMCRCRGGRGDGAAAAACVLRSSVVAERARRGGRVRGDGGGVCVARCASRRRQRRSPSVVAERARTRWVAASAMRQCSFSTQRDAP